MSYIIVFWDNSRLQVSDEIGVKLKQAIRKEAIKTFELGNSLYSVSGINKIIPKKEAYTTFPSDWGFLNAMIDALPSKEVISLEAGTVDKSRALQ